MTLQITGALFKTMILNGAAAIEHHKVEINELNVFPVPDGDTGTNMSLTMGAGATALTASAPASIGKAADMTAGALLRGARGNSGVILSLLFRGIARHLKDMETADAAEFANAVTSGVESAYKAVMKPAEGTILTVSRLSANAAVAEAERESDIETVLERAIKVGQEALANTINQNPVLKKAGVVDAGGKGFLIILEGMLRALRGEMFAAAPAPSAVGAVKIAERADFAGFETEDIKFAYCTEFIVSRKAAKDPSVLREFLGQRGDSIVVVDDDELIKVHVHSNEPGVILTEALTYGPLMTVKIENMHEQHSAKVIESQSSDGAKAPATNANVSYANVSQVPAQPDAAPADQSEAQDSQTASPAVASPEKEIGVVAVCAGDGMCGVFRDLGVDNIIVGGQTMNPSTEDILSKINATPAATVFVLPNNKNIIMAAEQCKGLTDKQIVVIPSKSMPQGISAMIALDAGASIEENTANMTEAISHVHTAQITYAARNSSFDGQDIKAGDYIALLEDSLVATGKDTASLVDAVASSLSRFSPEFLTVFAGENVDEQAADDVLQRLSTAIPGAEASIVFGGQPVYSYVISAE